MSDTVTLLGFVGLFHLIGGIVAGKSLRRGIVQGWSCAVLFTIVWGIGFGGIPLFIGVPEFMRMGVPYLAAVELFFFVGTFLAAALTPDWILDMYNTSVLVPVVLGGVIMVIGVILFVAIAGDSLPFAIFALAAFGGSGAVVFVTSAVKATRG